MTEPRQPCWTCGAMSWWRYRDRDRWHCTDCVPCLATDDVVWFSLEHDAEARR